MKNIDVKKLTDEEKQGLVEARLKRYVDEEDIQGLKELILNVQEEAAEKATQTEAEKIAAKVKDQLAEQAEKNLKAGAPAKEDDDPKKNHGFKGFGDFLSTVYKSPFDERLAGAETKALAATSDSAGGYLVPEEYAGFLFKDMVENSVMRRAGAIVIPTQRDAINMTTITETSHASNLYGGILGSWAGDEDDTISDSDPVFGSRKLVIEDLVGMTYVSQNLLDDSAEGLSALLTQLWGKAMAFFEDQAYIVGNGVNKPLGWRNSGSILTVARATASQVALADVANMLAKLHVNSWNTGAWVINPACVGYLVQLGNTNGLLWMPGGGGGLQEGIPARLLGLPVYFSAIPPTLGTEGDVNLIDPKHYIIADRQSLAVDVSKEFKFSTRQVTFRFVVRVGGQAYMDSSLTLADGSGTASAFVSLTDAA